MPATPKRVNVSQEDVAKKERGRQQGEGSYAAIVVPADYVAVLTDVRDHQGDKGTGWMWSFEVEGCNFDFYTSHSPASRWKLLELLDAFDTPADVGVADVDPNVYVGSGLGAHVAWKIDPATNPEKNFKEIKYVFSLSGLDLDSDGLPTDVSTSPEEAAPVAAEPEVI